jgi:hypothetical protein
MKLTLNIAILIAASIAVALLADAWRTSRHDSQQLTATLAAQNTIIQQAADRENQRDSQLTAALAAIQSQKQTVQTPQQAAKQLPLAWIIHDFTGEKRKDALKGVMNTEFSRTRHSLSEHPRDDILLYTTAVLFLLPTPTHSS